MKTDGMTASMPANTSGYIADRYTDTQAHTHTQASRATSLASLTLPLSLGACFSRFLFGWTAFIVPLTVSDPIPMRPEWVMSLARHWSGSQNSWTDTVSCRHIIIAVITIFIFYYNIKTSSSKKEKKKKCDEKSSTSNTPNRFDIYIFKIIII